ncbi:hypothetical protein ACFSL4_20965 [Streptomyces caeni]|uniref:Uncharacterized protein n=1 Tax=Streptomyces caeni TaxID=2307231 RepID=A0ABW4IVR9_9ACTN
MVTDWNDPDIGKGKGQFHVYEPKAGKVTPAGELTVRQPRPAVPHGRQAALP